MGVYLLGERAEESRAEPIDAQEALVSLIANSFATNALDTEIHARELQFLGALVRTTAIRRLYPQRNFTDVAELCKVISKGF